MNECRLIYKSVSAGDFVSNETVREISETGAENNRKLNISGLLILSGNQFLQVLEGPVQEVNDLFQKICRDERHTRIHLLSYELIRLRQFDTWSMRLVDLWDIEGNTRHFLKHKYPCIEDSIFIPEDPLIAYALLLDAKALSRR